MQATALIRPGEIDQWDQSLYAFLAEKERRTGSMRTVQSYSRMLQHFFGAVAKTPERITSPEVFSWAHGIGLSGKRPSSITIGARLACLSSFYKFLIRMGLMVANPCEAIERPKTVPSQPRGLSADDIRKLLAVIPETPTGLRDRAIVLTLTFTGRRRAEVMNLTAGSIVHEGDKVFYEYRGKGGKTGKRELPQPAYEAIVAALATLSRGFKGSVEPARLVTEEAESLLDQPVSRWDHRCAHQGGWPLRAPANRCGRRLVQLAASPAARSTETCGAISLRQGSRYRASTSSGTRRRSSAGTPASPSKT